MRRSGARSVSAVHRPLPGADDPPRASEIAEQDVRIRRGLTLVVVLCRGRWWSLAGLVGRSGSGAEQAEVPQIVF